MVSLMFFSPAACPPSQISQSGVRLRNGHVTCESCLLAPRVANGPIYHDLLENSKRKNEIAWNLQVNHGNWANWPLLGPISPIIDRPIDREGACLTPAHQDPPSAISHSSSEKQGSGPRHKKGMVIASFNVNSLLLHIDEIRTLVKDLGIHILAIKETNLDENIKYDLVSIEGYTIRRRDRNRHGGGVAIYIRDSVLC